jgi:hypothetical protein
MDEIDYFSSPLCTICTSIKQRIKIQSQSIIANHSEPNLNSFRIHHSAKSIKVSFNSPPLCHVRGRAELFLFQIQLISGAGQTSMRERGLLTPAVITLCFGEGWSKERRWRPQRPSPSPLLWTSMYAHARSLSHRRRPANNTAYAIRSTLETRGLHTRPLTPGRLLHHYDFLKCQDTVSGHGWELRGSKL